MAVPTDTDARTLEEILERAESAALSEARQHTDLAKAIMADLMVGLPAYTGLLGGLVGTAFGLVITEVRWIISIPALVVSVAALYFVVWRAKDKHHALQQSYVSAAESYWGLLRQRDLLRRAIERAQTRLKWMLVLSVIGQKAHQFIEAARANGAVTDDDRRKFCLEVLEVLRSDRHACLRFVGGDQTFNFHILRWNGALKHLEGFARTHGTRIEENNRVWNFGAGHVGSCYESNEALLLDDLQGTEGAGYRKQVRDLDRQVYRAIIDAPIPGIGGTWGVLVVTSGRPKQFQQDDLTPVALVAAILGTALAATA